MIELWTAWERKEQPRFMASIICTEKILGKGQCVFERRHQYFSTESSRKTSDITAEFN